MNKQSPYETLYSKSLDHCLWGNNPGRLIKKLDCIDHGNNVLDIGCGDGKNALYFEKKGNSVIGIDNSMTALRGLSNRFRKNKLQKRGVYIHKDIRDFDAPRDSFDVLISYGLYHCLTDNNRELWHRKIQDMVRIGGLLLFTCLTNGTPLPTSHGTGNLYLPALDDVMNLFENWKILHLSQGNITETHTPVIGKHQHSAVWVMAQRR